MSSCAGREALSEFHSFPHGFFRFGGESLQRPYNLIRADLLGEWLVVRQHPEGADPGQADLAGADLRQANLAGAHLDGADLTGAHLTDIRRMAGSQTQDCWRPAPRRGGRASPWPSSVSPENVRPPNLFLAGPSGRRQDGPSGTNPTQESAANARAGPSRVWRRSRCLISSSGGSSNKPSGTPSRLLTDTTTDHLIARQDSVAGY